jgi:hypothetical protein
MVEINSRALKVLYYVISYYQAYIATVKAILDKERVADIIVSDAVPNSEKLCRNLGDSSIFGNVIPLAEKEFVWTCRREFKKEYEKFGKIGKFLNGKRLWFASQKKIISYAGENIPFSLDEYAEIYVFGEGRSFAPYLHSRHKSFVLVEDCVNYYQRRDVDHLITRSAMIKPRPFYFVNKLLDFFGIYYYMGGYSRAVKAIEVNDGKNILLTRCAAKKLSVISREALVASLATAERELVRKTFAPDFSLNISGNVVDVIFTNPLLFDGFVKTEYAAVKIYENLINEFCGDADTIYIKPHPRDEVDYGKMALIGKNLFILDKYMPSEVFGFMDGVVFEKAVGISSTAVENAFFTKERINVGMSWLDEKIKFIKE